jgi:hypothetical protein
MVAQFLIVAFVTVFTTLAVLGHFALVAALCGLRDGEWGARRVNAWTGRCAAAEMEPG